MDIENNNILIIDTSSTSGSIALFKGGKCVAEVNEAEVATHGEWLLDSIVKLLKDSGTSLSEVGFFAMPTGPGSFTGLRVGITTLKGLAWGAGKDKDNDKKILGLSTLRALAMNIMDNDFDKYKDTLICPVLDARKGDIYGGVYKYDNNGVMTEVVKDSLVTPEEFVRVITACKSDGGLDKVVFTGKGLTTYGEFFAIEQSDSTQASPDTWNIKASLLGEAVKGGFYTEMTATEAAPHYLRSGEGTYKKLSEQVAQN